MYLWQSTSHVGIAFVTTTFHVCRFVASVTLHRQQDMFKVVWGGGANGGMGKKTTAWIEGSTSMAVELRVQGELLIHTWKNLSMNDVRKAFDSVRL